MIKKIAILVTSLLMITCTNTVIVGAEGASGVEGGSVTIEPKISFYEGEKERPGPTQSEEPKKDIPKDAPKKDLPKQSFIRSLLPKTGEEMAKFAVVGVGLLLIVFVLFFKKKKQEEEGEQV